MKTITRGGLQQVLIRAARIAGFSDDDTAKLLKWSEDATAFYSGMYVRMGHGASHAEDMCPYFQTFRRIPSPWDISERFGSTFDALLGSRGSYRVVDP